VPGGWDTRQEWIGGNIALAGAVAYDQYGIPGYGWFPAAYCTT
jgi:hypothetical protein